MSESIELNFPMIQSFIAFSWTRSLDLSVVMFAQAQTVKAYFFGSLLENHKFVPILIVSFQNFDS